MGGQSRKPGSSAGAAQSLSAAVAGLLGYQVGGRSLSAHRDAAREFFIRNQDRIIFGSDQVSTDERGYDFYASRFWVHRKLWETAYVGLSPIYDADCPPDDQPILRGLALPDEVLQKLYHDNATGIHAIGRPGRQHSGMKRPPGTRRSTLFQRTRSKTTMKLNGQPWRPSRLAASRRP